MNPHGVTTEKEALMLYTNKYLDGSQWQVTTLDGTKDVPRTTSHEALFFSFGRTLLKTLIVLIFLMCILWGLLDLLFYKITASGMCRLLLSCVGSSVSEEPTLSLFKTENFLTFPP
jgi:uncharacterized membrane protein